MALSNEARNLVLSAEAGRNDDQKFMSREAQELMAALILWAEAGDTRMQWNGAEGLNGGTGNTLAPAGGVLSTPADMYVTNASNTPDPFRQNASVHVTLTGTAAGKKINGVAGPLVIDLVDGHAQVTLSATGTGTVIATMSSPLPSPLLGADVLTVTFS